MFIVQATITRTTNAYTRTSQIPTFFLDENVQGIVDENHAKQIAISIINPTNNPNITVHVVITKE